MKNKIIIKLLDNKIILYKNNEIFKESTEEYIKNNFIYDYKILLNSLKETITKYKLSNLIIQNKIYILINKLYCSSNLLILKIIMNELGFSNYKLIYEEDLYKSLYKNVLSIWDTNGILIKNNKEFYIDINNKNDLKLIPKNTLLITSNKEVSKMINKDIIIYENTKYPIFKMLDKI